MSDIAAFLEARFSEDEQAARSVSYGNPACRWWGGVSGPCHDVEVLVELTPGQPLPPAVMDGHWGSIVAMSEDHVAEESVPVAQYIARWDPARILAEVTAKRRMLAAHQTGTSTHYHCRNHDHLQDWQCQRTGCRADVSRYCELGDYDTDPAACRGLLILAEPYADHGEFNQEWRLP